LIKQFFYQNSMNPCFLLTENCIRTILFSGTLIINQKKDEVFKKFSKIDWKNLHQ
jgi:hypothetical protein